MRHESRTTPANLRWFYAALAGLLLLCVVAGFAPSFFLRPLFTSKPLPAYLYLHGGVLTIWFGLLFAQSWLVAAHRVDLHRRLGVVGALNAAALVPLSALVVIRAIPRYISAGVPPAEIQFIVIGDLISLAIFSILVASALVWRRHREWHRRLMIVASIMIIGPAIARFERLGLAIPVPAVLLVLLAAMITYDLVRLRRLHRATIVSTLAVVLSLGALLSITGSATGQQIVDALHPGPVTKEPR